MIFGKVEGEDTFFIRDNGIGFKSEYADQIFNIFQRLHRKSEYDGTGIGLAMCKKICQNHHGEINAWGSSENGAVFNIFLPVKQHYPVYDNAGRYLIVMPQAALQD